MLDKVDEISGIQNGGCMAENVNLRESEYHAMVMQLEKMHNRHMAVTTQMIKEIKEFVSKNGAFNVDGTSAKITDLLDFFSSEVLALMEITFETSENAMANMVEAMESIDTP